MICRLNPAAPVAFAVVTMSVLGGLREGVVRRVDPPKGAADWSIRVIDDATPLLQSAIDEVFRLGGGRVVVGRGFYSIKGIRLRSRVTLHLERGAILQASRNAADFDILGKDAVEPVPAAEYERGRSRRWSPPRGEQERTSPRLHISDPLSPWNDAVIRILNAKDVAIIGEEGSVIDGANGYNPNGELHYRGVHGISAIASTNVVLRGFTIRHAGHWAMMPSPVSTTAAWSCADATFPVPAMRSGSAGATS